MGVCVGVLCCLGDGGMGEEGVYILLKGFKYCLDSLIKWAYMGVCFGGNVEICPLDLGGLGSKGALFFPL